MRKDLDRLKTSNEGANKNIVATFEAVQTEIDTLNKRLDKLEKQKSEKETKTQSTGKAK